MQVNILHKMENWSQFYPATLSSVTLEASFGVKMFVSCRLQFTPLTRVRDLNKPSQTMHSTSKNTSIFIKKFILDIDN